MTYQKMYPARRPTDFSYGKQKGGFRFEQTVINGVGHASPFKNKSAESHRLTSGASSDKRGSEKVSGKVSYRSIEEARINSHGTKQSSAEPHSVKGSSTASKSAKRNLINRNLATGYSTSKSRLERTSKNSTYPFRADNRASSTGSRIHTGGLYEAQRRAEYERRLSELNAYEKQLKKERADARKIERAKHKESRKRIEAEKLKKEIKIEKKKIPISFIALLSAATIMIMGIIFCFSEIYNSTTTLSEMKDTLAEIESESDSLKLKLEEKNDISMIEKKATEELMMVKEDSVQKKYISLSSGDRIVLDDDESSEETDGFFGTMLSSVSAAFDNLLDYFN